MPKYLQIAGLLEDRVSHGDYLAKPIPSETELADELQANRRTVRKAVQQLIQRGRLTRQTNGRLALPEAAENAALHLALISSTYPTPFVATWAQAVERVARARGWRLRQVGFTHWNDPTLFAAMRGFDGTFLIPPGQAIPEHVLRRVRRLALPLIVLEDDASAAGLPSLRSFTPSSIAKLLNHLATLGHQRIACLNTQPATSVVRERIEQWELWTAAHRAAGPLINEPVVPGQVAADRAYRVMRRLLKRNELDATAVFCVTGFAAMGVMRAIVDAGLKVGQDISVCATDDEAGRAQYLNPSLTCLKDPPWDPYINVCLDWFARGGKNWLGPLLIQPPEVPLFAGESTGSAPAITS